MSCILSHLNGSNDISSEISKDEDMLKSSLSSKDPETSLLMP